MVSKRALDPKIVAAIVEVVGYQGRGGYLKNDFNFEKFLSTSTIIASAS